MKNLMSELEERAAEFERILGPFLPEASGSAALVIEALRYSLEAGGKRLRPVILIETGRMYGARDQVLYPFAAALEMIHTYSLVHDDLPAMDNDEYRRGRKTTHIVYGEGMAVLAGDALLNLAFETALKAFDAIESYTAEDALSYAKDCRKVIRALNILSKNAGIEGMIGGQCADLCAENDPGSADAESLLYIHEHKTGSMIESAFTIGAVLGGAPEEDIKALSKAAMDVGTAFQIRDDILDVEGEAEKLGKTPGSDLRDGKVTYVTLHGMDASVSEVGRLTDEALTAVRGLSVRSAFLEQLCVWLTSRDH